MNALEKYAAKRFLIEKLAGLGGVGRVMSRILNKSKTVQKTKKWANKNPLTAHITGGVVAGNALSAPFVAGALHEAKQRKKSPFYHRRDVATAREGKLPKPGTLRAGELTEQSLKNSKLRREGGYLDFHSRQSVPRATSGN